MGDLRQVSRISAGLLSIQTRILTLGLGTSALSTCRRARALDQGHCKVRKRAGFAERQLGNEGFLAKAPAHIVEGLKKQESETRLLLEKARAALNALPPA